MPQEPRGPIRFLMQYQVLARKWRPQNFSDLVGQEHVSRTLLHALHSGRVAHAFLFSGPRGSGKTTTARILAKALNCHAGKLGEPCGTCVACTEIAAGNCLDVLEIDAASNRGIDEIRELREKVRYKPARDRNKIFIIDEVHMLTTEAFNALLKTLEEPPPHVAFIMATTEYHKIPATILSRCQQYSFKLIPYPLILARLRQIADAEKIQISRQALEQVVFSSGGSMRDAMSALDQVIAFSGDKVRDEDVSMLLGLVEPAVLGDTIRAIASTDIRKLLEIIGGEVESGQDLQNFCRRLLAQFRNLMILKAGVADPALLGVPESLFADLREQAGLFSREDLLRLFDAFLKIEADLKYATQVRFQLEMGLIELAHISRMRPLEELIQELKGLLQDDSPAAQGSKPASVIAAADPPGHKERASPDPLPAHVPKPAVVPQPLGQPPAPVAAPPEPRSIPDDGEKSGASSHHVQRGRELLTKIAECVQKPQLIAVLQALAGAELRDNLVILEIGSANEFFRRQVKENLAVLSEAASAAIGRPVRAVVSGEQFARNPRPAESRAAPGTGKVSPEAVPRVDPLERAKRDPVVQSFLETFPGPVKAEDLD